MYLKILYIAFACDPYAGSEAQCGWAWAYSMRKYAEVYVLTRRENKDHIEHYLKQNKIEDVLVFYHDIPSWLNMYYKTGKAYQIYYRMWLSSAPKAVLKLYRKHKFDVIHQVTLGDFRNIISITIKNPKFIFGPVGGAQLTPKVFNGYVRDNILAERGREFVNKTVKLNPSYRKKLNRADIVLAANMETKEYLSGIMNDPSRCYLLTENGVIENKLPDCDLNKSNNSKVVMLWAGRIINRKGLSFLLDVLPMIKSKTEWELKIVGEGPESQSLKDKCERLDLKSKVQFCGRLLYTDMQSVYQSSDLFVFPSLRETTGTVLFEAMSNGLPVVSFAQNGANLLINENCGRKIEIGRKTLDEIKNNFADILTELIDNAMLRQELGVGARNQVEEKYLWGKKCHIFYKEFLKEQ